MGKTNAKTEFLNHIKNYSKSKVICATIQKGDDEEIKSRTLTLTTGYTTQDWEQFLTKIDFIYDSGYGGQELFGTIWYQDGTWSDRGEYDGTLYSQILKSKPDTEIVATRLTLDKDQYFQSGKFILSDDMKTSIDSTLMEILNNNGIIIKIEIESSTDKQGLSQNLQNDLKKLGYTPDNKGLSDARCNSVSDFLEQLGVSDSLILKNKLFEKGEGEIEQSARYVTVDFYYMIVSESVKPAEYDVTSKVKKTYYLSKEQKTTGKTIKLSRRGTKTKKLGPIKNHLKRPAVKCAEW